MCLASDGAAAGKEVEHIRWVPERECNHAKSSSPPKGPQHAQPAAELAGTKDLGLLGGTKVLACRLDTSVTQL